MHQTLYCRILMKCINEDFPAGTNLSHLEREQEAHDAFAEARRRVYIGRQEYFDYIDNYFVKIRQGERNCSLKIVIVWYSRPGIIGTLINKNSSLWGQISWEKSSCMIISSDKWDNTSDKGGTYFQCLLLCYVQQSISTYILGNLHFTNIFFFRFKIFCSNFQTQSRGTHPTSQTFMTSKGEKKGAQRQRTCKKDHNFNK